MQVSSKSTLRISIRGNTDFTRDPHFHLYSDMSSSFLCREMECANYRLEKAS